jgi:hypothetical protein
MDERPTGDASPSGKVARRASTPNGASAEHRRFSGRGHRRPKEAKTSMVFQPLAGGSAHPLGSLPFYGNMIRPGLNSEGQMTIEADIHNLLVDVTVPVVLRARSGHRSQTHEETYLEAELAANELVKALNDAGFVICRKDPC